MAINTVGKDFYEAFFKFYTEKQWSTDPKLLPPEVFTRLPLRFDYRNSYFTDTFQGIPIHGYNSLFESMLKNSKISIHLDTDFFDVRNMILPSKLICYSGPIDRFFEFSEGALNWRTVDLDFETIPLRDFQGCAVINYPDIDVPFTRIHEFKHLQPEKKDSFENPVTVIAREYSRAATRSDDPYYPINTNADRIALEKYRVLIESLPNVIFGGRLGSYKYLDMHMAIGQALTTFEHEVSPKLTGNN